MAEAVSQSEVEDVLSSIRRLVGSTETAERSGAGHASDGRLLLTPQLRVAEPRDDTESVLLLSPEDEVAPEPEQERETSEPLVLSAPVAQRVISRRTDISELTAKIAALESAIARTVDQWEPDGTGRDAYAGTQSPRMNWQDNVELDASGKPFDETPNAPDLSTAAGPAASTDAAEAEEMIVDEEALRCLVAQIVRAELQGELGERITRNVRKLVQREIQRALAVQTLD